jgi:hypothetical protein
VTVDTVDRHGSIGVIAQPAMFDFSGNGRFYTFGNIATATEAAGIFRSSQLGSDLKGRWHDSSVQAVRTVHHNTNHTSRAKLGRTPC